MAKVQDKNFVTLHGWMANRLSLRGGELIAYALIYQFSQSNASVYTGGVPYLADWLGCSQTSARKYLHALEEKGYVTSEDGTINGVPFRNYRAVDTLQNLGDTPQNLGGDPQKIGGYTLQNLGGNNINNDLKVDVNITTNNNRGKAFRKPTLEEVRAYADERCSGVDAEQFFSYYEANGWKVGKNPMKDWRAAFRYWEKNERERQAAPKRKESTFEKNLRTIDRMFGTDYHQNYYGNGNGND